MPRVVPSRVVDFIDQIQTQPFAEFVRLKNIGSATLSAVLALTDEIPDELLTMDTQAYGSLIVAKEEIKDVLATWTSNRNAGQTTLSFDRPHHLNPVAQIRKVLAVCPDESPAPGTSELKFIADAALRTNLRIDIGAINRALSNGEWKAATVLAGSAAEALLLWALRQRQALDITSAITAAKASGNMTANPDPNDLDRWNLHECIEVSAQLGIIKPNTAKQTRLAKDFRNFIHPGVAQRLGEKCDRATALSAVAGMEHVVRDLTP
jgi:hypothetical protein